MSEKLQITCVCGYENWVSPDHIGQTISCAMCGADLAVDEAAASGQFNSPDPAEFDDEPAPESPVNPPHRRSVPPAGPTLEERVESAREKHRPLSPFEDEDEEQGAPAPRETESRAVESPAPRSRARSPFEAGEPEREQTQGRGPFTLEPQSGPPGGVSYAERMEATRPKESRSRHVVVATVSPHDMPSGENCSECGRALRGSWDRIETEKGVICYICSNQAVQGLPKRLAAEKPKGGALRDYDLADKPAQPAPVDHRPWYTDTESPEFKRVIFALAAITLLVAAYFFFFDDGQAPATGAAEAPAPAEVELTAFTAALLQAWQVFAFFASFLSAVYIVLRAQGDTPFGRIVPDLLYMGAICVPVSVFFFVVTTVQNIFSGFGHPAVILVVAVIFVVKWYVIFSVVMRFVHLRISDILLAFVIYLLLSRIVFRAAGVLLFRAMGIL
jgi:hypothetical protein